MNKEKEKYIEILQHNILYWYSNGQDMPEHEQEWVKEQITQGYNQGELNDYNHKARKEIRGWYQIVWPSKD